MPRFCAGTGNTRSILAAERTPLLLRRFLLFLVLLAGVFALPSPVDATEAADEATFVELINELRTKHRLSTLEVHPELVAPSREWAEYLASQNDLVHAPELATGVTAYWIKLGENIGTASNGDVDELFAAFVASPSHLENLLDPTFDYVGVGVVYDDEGRMWTTHRFMSVDASSEVVSPTPMNPPPMNNAAVAAVVADLVGSGV